MSEQDPDGRDDAEFRVIQEEQGAPVRAILTDALAGDPLFVKLVEIHKGDAVLTVELVAGLTPGMHYVTSDLPRLIGASNVPESTIRTWVDRFEDYIQPVRDGRNYKFPMTAVVRVRIVFILIKELRWTFQGIRNVLAGLVETDDLLERAGQGETREVVATLENLSPVKGVDFRSVDPRVLFLMGQLVDLAASAEAGRLVLNSDALPATVRERLDQVSALEEENARLRGELEEATKGLGQVRQAVGSLEGWAAIRPEEVTELLAQQRQPRSWLARLLGL